jgi:hypothetical protein
MTQALEKAEVNEVTVYKPEDVNKAWERANKGMRDVVLFGSMLAVIDSSFPRETEHRGGGHTEAKYTLKGWLTENCPEVNYMTAMGYKRLATLAAASFNCQPHELAHLLRIPAQHLTPSEQAKTEIIDKYLTGASKRSLLNDWATQKPGALPGQKRKEAVKMTPEQSEAKLRELANHGMITARNTLVGIAAEKELSSRLDRTQARALIKDMKAAIQKIAEAIA